MISLFYDVFNYFNISDNDTQTILEVLFFACVFCLMLRIIVFLNYRAHISILPWRSKKIKSERDLEELSTKRTFLSRIINDYTAFKGREVGAISVRAIAEKHINRLNFLGIPFGAVERFVSTFEWGFLICGGLFVLISDNKLPIFVLIAIAYGILKLSSLLFDIRNCREILLNNVICYIDKEISQYFATDTMSAVLALKNEIKLSLDHQTANLSGAISAMGIRNEENFKAAFDRIVKICAEAMEAYKSFPLIISSSADKIAQNTDTLNETLSILKESSEKYIGSISSQQKELTLHLNKLNELTEYLKQSADFSTAKGSGIEQELAYIRLNQQTLSETLVQFELALKETTSGIGDGLGKIIDFHVDEGYKRLSDGLIEDFSRIIAGNEQLIERLSEFFGELKSHYDSQALGVIGLKEQIDLNFETMKKKLDNLI